MRLVYNNTNSITIIFATNRSVFVGFSNDHRVDASFFVLLNDEPGIFRFHDDAARLAEHRLQQAVAMWRHSNIDANVSGKGHFENRWNEAAVADVMTGSDATKFFDQPLSDVEGGSEHCCVTEVGAFSPNLLVAVSENGAAWEFWIYFLDFDLQNWMLLYYYQ